MRILFLSAFGTLMILPSLTAWAGENEIQQLKAEIATRALPQKKSV